MKTGESDVAIEIRARKGGMFDTRSLSANSFGLACYLVTY